MLELAVLGLLREQPLHGYELKKRLSDSLGSFWGVSFGSLYPALRRLERAGAIERIEGDEAEPGAATPLPPTGSLAGDLAAARLRRRPRPARRPRKAYRITPPGTALFGELLAADSDPADERAFALRLSFCRYLEPPARLTLLERRRAQLAERLARSERARGGSRTIDRYTRSLVEHRTRATEHDLQWIDELIASERRELTEHPEGATA